MNVDLSFFRPEALGRRWGMSGSSVRRLLSLGKLPPPIRISTRVFGWSLETVQKIERDRDTAAMKRKNT